jgi:hypothetical protein
LGYFTRFHITVYPSHLRNQATDIDLYAVRFSNQLNPSLFIVEAMGTRDSVSEVFRAYGFKSYFRNCEAILVSDKIDPLVLDTSKKLGIRVFSMSRLREITANDVKWAKERARPHVPLTVDDGLRIQSFLKTLKTLDDPIFWQYHYLWLENNPYLKLAKLHGLSEKARSFLGTENQQSSNAVEWFLSETLLLSMLASIEIASDCIDLSPGGIDGYLIDKFYNLGTSKESKMRTKQSIQLLVDTIKDLSQGKVTGSEVEIVPPYLNKLGLLVRSIIDNAPFMQSYLLLNEAVYRNRLQGKSKNIREFTSGESQRKSITQINSLLLRILYDTTIPSIFNDFV